MVELRKEKAMLFAVIGFFRPGIDTAPQRLQGDFNEHLGQPLLHIRLAGAIRARDGRRIGYMELMEANSFDQPMPISEAALLCRAPL
jgi:hypothetical protein